MAKRGRPKGSKNKPKEDNIIKTRKRGRPKGSKNKPKNDDLIKKMGRPKGSKNKLNEDKVPKKRGRPKGSKNKPKEDKIIKKRGRPKGSKNASDEKKCVDGLSEKDKWLAGLNHKFKDGDVIQDIDFKERIGVISRAEKEYKMYTVKWHDESLSTSQNFKVAKVHETFIKKSRKENPIDIPSWKKYPGPSAREIERLQTKLKNKIETPEDVEKRIESLEEQYKKKRRVNKEIEETVEDENIDNIICLDEDENLENLNEQLNTEEMYRRLKEELEDA